MTPYESYMAKAAGIKIVGPTKGDFWGLRAWKAPAPAHGPSSPIQPPNPNLGPVQTATPTQARQGRSNAARYRRQGGYPGRPVASPPAPNPAPAGSAPGRTWDEHVGALADWTERLVAAKNAPQAPRKSRGWGLGHTALLGGSVIAAGGMMGLGNAVGNQSAYQGF